MAVEWSRYGHALSVRERLHAAAPVDAFVVLRIVCPSGIADVSLSQRGQSMASPMASSCAQDPSFVFLV